MYHTYGTIYGHTLLQQHLGWRRSGLALVRYLYYQKCYGIACTPDALKALMQTISEKGSF